MEQCALDAGRLGQKGEVRIWAIGPDIVLVGCLGKEGCDVIR